MRIDNVEVLNLHFEYPGRCGYRYAGGLVTSRVTSIIRVTTDTGLIGWGASYAYPDLVRIIIENHLKRHLLGEDPRDIERLWDRMYELTRWYGRKGVAISALGGIDIALWDLKGKAEGKPVYELLGGTKQSVPAYASGLFWEDDVHKLETEAASHLEHGFIRVKTRLGHSEEYDREAVRAIRRGLGPTGEMMVDGSHRYQLDAAVKMARVLEDERAVWFEEPFPPEELDLFVELRKRIQVPLAAGENEFGVQGFRELLRAGALDIVQPDVCRSGGITECRRIAQMACDHGLRVGTHTWSDAIALVANAHLVAAIPNGLTVEMDQTGNPFIEDLLTEPLTVKEGRLQLSGKPGLGIEVCEESLAHLLLPRDQWIPDGNYSDLIFGKEHFGISNVSIQSKRWGERQ